jgi:pimeloyl-ACP methyl ester carboxylesterase
LFERALFTYGLVTYALVKRARFGHGEGQNMGQYVMAGGVRTYYEEHGEAEAEPLVLLHGGGATGDSWQAQVAGLSGRFRVLVPERRGHGRTPDVPGPVSLDLMAGDTAAFLEALGTGPAHLVGWSDGAAVALRVAMRRPELVRKLVLIGLSIHRSGETAMARALFEDPAETAPFEAALRGQYEPLSPDGPEHFPVVFEKLLRMWREQRDIPLSDLAGVRMPVLVMQGDNDGVRVEHSAAVATALPDAQLAVVPGTSHVLPIEKPGLVNQLLLDFLADEQVPMYMPMGALDG